MGTLRALYVCYLSLDDPLVHTQVVAYLAGLARRGHEIRLLTFEVGRLPRSRRRELADDLKARGITWHGLRYHKRPSLLATAYDLARGAICSAWLVRRHRIDALHARSHVPAAMALIAARFAPFRLIFDVRGLMAEEYEDAGRWRRNSVPFRLAKAVERRALEKADAIVLLTERVREHILGGAEDTRVHVIPCCADIEAIEAASCRRAGVRARLGLNERTVLVYVGKFSGWYMEREMVEFFELTRELRADAHFLVLTQSDPRPIHREFARLGVEESSWTVTACPPSEIGEYLAAADAGIAFIRPSFSKISSSPTKVGEYLAAGLPLICIAGVGDVDGLVGSYDVGVSLTRWDRTMLARGAELLLDLIAKDGVAVRARRAARENLSLDDVGIPRYDQIYRSLAETW